MKEILQTELTNFFKNITKQPPSYLFLEVYTHTWFDRPDFFCFYIVITLLVFS